MIKKYYKVGISIFILVALLGAFVFVLKNPVSKFPNTLLDRISTPLLEASLQKHLAFLTSIEPPRSVDHPESLKVTQNYILEFWKKNQLQAEIQEFDFDGKKGMNIIAHAGPEKAKDLIIIGAHYDVCGDQPGADDNGSGLAALLEISAALKLRETELTHRFAFVAYANEEPPIWNTPGRGSLHHAAKMKAENENVYLMISLETMGFYTDQPNSQEYPMFPLKWIYPSTGNFITAVGKIKEWPQIRQLKRVFPHFAQTSMQSINTLFPVGGTDLSDHKSYWEYGFPAIMITDTAYFRNKNYHKKTDTLETIDLRRLADVVHGLAASMFYM